MAYIASKIPEVRTVLPRSAAGVPGIRRAIDNRPLVAHTGPGRSVAGTNIAAHTRTVVLRSRGRTAPTGKTGSESATFVAGILHNAEPAARAAIAYAAASSIEIDNASTQRRAGQAAPEARTILVAAFGESMAVRSSRWNRNSMSFDAVARGSLN